MLTIKEVNSEEQYNELRQNEINTKDYLYILKYNGTLVLSDNGITIPLGGKPEDSISDEEIQKCISDILTDLTLKES